MRRQVTVSAVILLWFFIFVAWGCGSDDDPSTSSGQATADDDNDADGDDDDDNDDDNDATLAGLRVGAARTDITPADSIIMGGYGTYFLSDVFCRWSQGVHDPLYASALALAHDEDKPILLINLDTLGIIITDAFAIQDRLAQTLGLPADHVIVTSTHNHHGPDTIGLWGLMVPPRTGRDDAYIAQMIDGAVAAATAAVAALQPARVFAAQGQEPRYHQNEQRTFDPDAKLDSTMTILQFTTPDGEPLASLMSWGCHATAMGPGNNLISADFPGAYYRRMDADLGGVNLFVNGNLGGGVLPTNNDKNEDPLHPAKDWGTWDQVEGYGCSLADSALALLAEAQELEDTTLLVAANEIRAELRNPLFALLGWVDLIPRPMPGLGEYGRSFISVLKLGPVTLATVPGETAPDVGIRLREIIGGRYQIIANVSQDWIGYILTTEQYQNLFYIYYSILSPGPETDEAIVLSLEELLAAF